MSVCIDAPVSEVWAQLARLGDIRLWSEAVVDAHCEGMASGGVGAERTCDLRGGITVNERPSSQASQRSLTVMPPRKSHDLELKGARINRLLEPIFARQVRR